MTASATVTYDPRLPDGRVAAGRHTIKITWRVSSKGKPSAFTGTVDIDVTGDGVVKTVGNQGAGLDDDPLPLGLRYAATIDATRDGAGYRLAVRVPAGIEVESYQWRASAGRIAAEEDGHGVARFLLPRSGEEALVTCLVRGDHSSFGIAAWRIEAE